MLTEQQALDRLRAILDDVVGPLLLPEDDTAIVSDGILKALLERGSIGPLTLGHGSTGMGYTLLLEDW